jgi:hypothetical protein
MNQFNPKPVSNVHMRSADSMPEAPEERRFRLAFTIMENPEFDGVHALIALLAEEGNPVPQLAIQAGGVEPSDAGAAMIADMLRDAAEAIDEYVGKERVHTDTAALPTVKPRPRFNPR